MTYSINYVPSAEVVARKYNIARMASARTLYAVAPDDPKVGQYLLAVHNFFKRLRIEDEFNTPIVAPVNHDQPVSLISYLKWEWARKKGFHFVPAEAELSDQMLAAISCVEQSFKALSSSNVPETERFPMYVLAKIERKTLDAVISLNEDGYKLVSKRHASQDDFSHVDRCLLKINALHRQIKYSGISLAVASIPSEIAPALKMDRLLNLGLSNRLIELLSKPLNNDSLIVSESLY